MMAVVHLLVFVFLFVSPGDSGLFKCDWDSSQCEWKWDDDTKGLKKMSGRDVSNPSLDSQGNPDGHFLYLPSLPGPPSHDFSLTSPLMGPTNAKCVLLFSEHSSHVPFDSIKVIVARENASSVVAGDRYVTGKDSWQPVSQRLGAIPSPFKLIIEFIPTNNPRAHLAIDDVRLENCFPDEPHSGECDQRHFQCAEKTCVEKNRVCDLHVDCPGGDDERQDCDKVPAHARCDFETPGDEMCGWSNDQDDDLEWKRHQGPLDRHHEPRHDQPFKDSSGHYIYLDTKGSAAKMGHLAVLNSSTFPPPPKYHSESHSPYFNTCQVRFRYYMWSRGKSGLGDLILNCIEKEAGRASKETRLWRLFGRQEEAWLRAVVSLPRHVNSYYLQFVGSKGFAHGFVGLDDITLSPECFGIGVNWTNADPTDASIVKIGTPPDSYTRLQFGTCGARGRFGPNANMCANAYEASRVDVHVLNDSWATGVQTWTVNKTGIYSVLARGASGGKGARNVGQSRGAFVRGVFTWTAGDTIYMLVGQQGSSSCQWTHCSQTQASRSRGSVANVKAASIGSGGGGGGGATYVFKIIEGRSEPILVAAGGGGFSVDPAEHLDNPDGRPGNNLSFPYGGKSTANGPGGGGGWEVAPSANTSTSETRGLSLLEGGFGGKPCPVFASWEAYGGFGGGGGACQAGGGGGGYAGGDAADPDHREENGQGGMSFASGRYALAAAGEMEGHGSVDIIPAIEGCGCSYLCVILDPATKLFVCICEENWRLASDDLTCEAMVHPESRLNPIGMPRHILIIIVCIVVLMICLATASFFLYHRYRRQKIKTLRQELMGNAELQLNRLRQQTGGMVTEYNPNYEFGGSTCTIQDLKEVPRECLALVKALGQGAFGEVYQGCLNLPSETRDLPVAVKTLPELSSSQAEMDFLMEALIMSKFNHPNIVRFIGVCFEKLPKFIVLELLPGGDLKSFLRELRPKPDRPSPLTMGDLLRLAMDVARGCQYLEENHFIHRDIAARNCLLSSKDVTRVVKIADFGMARDIYRADYYRKGGKTMLPVKWMPPEAFLDGIFTSKTDVWSFGVLLWEVMSLGYMPYPGRGNQEVMQLVTSGGRLEPPNNCPNPVYHIMVQCWSNQADDRPNFITIQERIGYCLQDPDVITAPLPIFHRPPSMERDATVMRPPDSEDRLLQVQRSGDTEPLSPVSTDYLIPIPASNYSLSTERTDLASSVDSIDKLLELEEPKLPAAPAPSPIPMAPPSTGKKRAGGYTSIPTSEDNAVIGNDTNAVWQRADPPTHNSSVINKTSLALDPSTLAKQHPTRPFSCINSSMTPTVNSKMEQKVDPFIIANHLTEKEVSC